MNPSEVAESYRGPTVSTRARLCALAVASNVVGAAILAALAVWVLPLHAWVADGASAWRINVALATGYAPAAVVGAVVAGWFWLRPPRRAGHETSPTDRDHADRRTRRAVVRAPMRLALVQAVAWGVGLALFVAVDARFGPAFEIAVVEVILLGGIATVTVAYRCTELYLRREVARIVVHDPPSGRWLSGVAVRSLGAWALGTGVPLAGLAFTGVAASQRPELYTVPQLGVVVLVLAVGGFTVGLAIAALSSRSTTSSVLAVARALERVRDDDLTVTVPVTDTTELGRLQAGFTAMVSGLRDRERIRELFGRQVGTDVARAAVNGELDLDGEAREVAVVFVDLIGSTSLAATTPPTEVVDVLNRFFAEVIAAVAAGGGWINKFEGDAALAVFGAPDRLADPAACALRTARDLADRLRAADLPLAAGIGVSAGPVVAGTIGDATRYEYTVIGDPVNEAARLCSEAKHLDGRVAASGAALERAGDAETARWSVVGSRRLRGRLADTAIAVPLRPAADPRTPARRVPDAERGSPLAGPLDHPATATRAALPSH